MAQPLSSMQRLELGSAIAAFDGGDNDIARTMSQTKRTMDGALSADPTHMSYLGDFMVTYTALAVVAHSKGTEKARALRHLRASMPELSTQFPGAHMLVMDRVAGGENLVDVLKTIPEFRLALKGTLAPPRATVCGTFELVGFFPSTMVAGAEAFSTKSCTGYMNTHRRAASWPPNPEVLHG